jgi:hypothetical protein
MCFREEHTTAGQDVRRVARVARRGVEAVLVLEAEVGCAELRQVAEDAGAFIGCVVFSGEGTWLVASVQGLTFSSRRRWWRSPFAGRRRSTPSLSPGSFSPASEVRFESPLPDSNRRPHPYPSRRSGLARTLAGPAYRVHRATCRRGPVLTRR